MAYGFSVGGLISILLCASALISGSYSDFLIS